jgi:hypothetical protein
MRASLVRRTSSLLLAVLVLTGCEAGTEAPGGSPAPPPPLTPAPTGGSSACAPPALSDRSIVVGLFRDASGGCLPATSVVAIRCGPDRDPVIALGLATGRASLFLGGRFAVPTDAPPADPTPVGMDATQRVLVAGDLLFVDDGVGIARWLRLPRSSRGSPTTPLSAAMVGDSILDGASTVLPDALPEWELAIDGVVGRGSGTGVAVVLSAVSSAPDVLVVELGTNDEDPSVFRANADSILDSAADVSLVVWVVPRTPQTITLAIARELRRAAATRPNVVLAGWDVAAPEEALASDGVHLLPGQESVFADFLAPWLRDWVDAALGRGDTACVRDVRAAVRAAGA